MAKRQVKEEQNPLLSRNIPPPPPAATDASPAITSEKNDQTTLEETNRRGEAQDMPQAPAASAKRDKATIELSVYLTPTLYDQLEDLRSAYRRRTGKRITANAMVRILIERGLDIVSEISD